MPTAVNPVLTGFHPDPSICRVDDAFYVATSTFGFHPGIPIHRSTDLQSWELVGHVLIGETWPDLAGTSVSHGIWAPTLRHHDGLFWVVYPLTRDGRGSEFFVTTAADPAGPWSEPVLLPGAGIDPSLFFDDDGRCWFTAARDALSPTATGPGEIWMRELDTATRELVGPEHVLWHGALAGSWLEAPHLYRRGDRYLLIGAEGGTERNHAVTAAWADEVTGPYRTDGRSPLLTHRHLHPDTPVQNVGHADLVDGPDGRSWAVVLGVRSIDGHHTLGRETFVVPVEWTDAGPVFAPDTGRVAVGPEPAVLAPSWLSLRGPAPVEIDGDVIRLSPQPLPLTSTGTPAFVAVRQDAHETQLTGTFAPAAFGDGTDAGIAAFHDSDTHVTMGVAADGAITVTHTARGEARVIGRAPAPTAQATLRVRCDMHAYAFGLVGRDGFEPIAEVPHSALSTETAGGFVGVTLGFWAIGPASSAQVVVSDVRRSRPGA